MTNYNPQNEKLSSLLKEKNLDDKVEQKNNEQKISKIYYSVLDKNKVIINFNQNYLLDTYDNVNLLSDKIKIDLSLFKKNKNSYEGIIYYDKIFPNEESKENYKKNKKKKKINKKLYKVIIDDKVYYSFEEKLLINFFNKKPLIQKEKIYISSLLKLIDNLYVKKLKG